MSLNQVIQTFCALSWLLFVLLYVTVYISDPQFSLKKGDYPNEDSSILQAKKKGKDVQSHHSFKGMLLNWHLKNL